MFNFELISLKLFFHGTPLLVYFCSACVVSNLSAITLSEWYVEGWAELESDWAQKFRLVSMYVHILPLGARTLPSCISLSSFVAARVGYTYMPPLAIGKYVAHEKIFGIRSVWQLYFCVFAFFSFVFFFTSTLALDISKQADCHRYALYQLSGPQLRQMGRSHDRHEMIDWYTYSLASFAVPPW